MALPAFVAPALIGGGLALLTKRDPIKGAIIGGVTGGLLGGVDFGSALSSTGGSVASSGPVLGGQTLAGAATTPLGAASATNLVSGAANEAVSGGVSTVGQNNTYSELLGGNAALQPDNIGMGGATSELNKVGGYVYTPEELEVMKNIKEFGPMTGGVEEPTQSFTDKITSSINFNNPYANMMMAQGLLGGGSQSQGITPVQSSIKPPSEPKIGKPLAVNVPRRREGFGGYSMFRR